MGDYQALNLPLNGIRSQKNGTEDMVMAMANQMVKDEFCAARAAYREQLEFGSAEDTALNLATIVYQQRHPCVPVKEARAIVCEALGVGR